MACLSDRRVIVYSGEGGDYPGTPPFHPQVRYPEYCWAETGAEPNLAYQVVRECFHLAGLDEGRYGTPDWSPLADLIHRNETVLLKPNMVHQQHPRDPQGVISISFVAPSPSRTRPRASSARSDESASPKRPR